MNKIHPPKFAARILTWLIRDDLAEEVLGDLEEKFYSVAESKSLIRARLNFWYQVVNYIRPFALTSKHKLSTTIAVMFRHNLTLTFRNFLKNKSQFLINLTGLSTGLACVLFIYLWIADERQVDGYHEKDARLYQVMSNHSDASGIHTWKGVPGMLLEEIQTSVPEVESAVAMTDVHEFSLSVGDSYFKADGKFSSRDFFDVFTFPLIEGFKEQALSSKSSIVITRSLAEKLFKRADVVGEQVTWHMSGMEKILQVTAVVEDNPKGTSEPFDFLMSWDYYHDDLISYKNWNNYYGRIAVVLNQSADKGGAENKIDQILKEKQDSDEVDLFLAKFSDKYLYSKYENGEQAGGRIEYVHLFSIIGLFILFIASANFINLSTARASHRTKEIGVKKAMGASRSSLIQQFFTESLLMSVIALLVALALVWLLMPQFNLITGKHLTLYVDTSLFIAMAMLVIFVGLVAGIYPALYLSGFRSIEVLKGKITRTSGENWGRKILVVTQFSLSIIMIMSVMVVYNQMQFIKTKNLGYDRENLIYFDREGDLMQKPEAFLSELKNLPDVSGAALSGFIIGGGNSTGGVSWEGKTDRDQIQFWEIRSGYGLIEILAVEVLQGRSFSDLYGADSLSVMVNESAVRAMGMDDPVGKNIQHYTGEKKIVGVVKDFNFTSLHTKVEPTIFLFAPEETYYITAKLNKGNEAEALEKIQSVYEDFNPGYVFKPKFINQDYQALYASEEKVSSLSKYFAGLAVLISCLGLFGLVSFTTEQRRKEIGIRKVLGSDVFSIVLLLSRDFTRMVLAAIVIALPIAYLLTSKWLENFAYAIDLKWWFFVGSAFIALTIAWLTLGLNTLKAANSNPVDCLRDE